jgi:hypothetical protein
MARMRRGQRGLLIAIAAVAVGVGMVVFVRKGTTKGSELPVYTTGAARMLDGEEIYRPSDEKPFTYPPFFAVPFMPLAGCPAEPPRPAAYIAAWYLVNVAALAWIAAIVQRRLFAAAIRGRAPPVALFWSITAVLAARHVSAVFENQSHDLLVFLLVALGADAFCRLREARAGAWLGIAAACKATPLLFGWPWLLQRRALALGGLAAGAAAATLLPDVLFPRADGQLWVAAWYHAFLSSVRLGATASAAGAWNAHSFLNQSLSGTLHRLLTPVESGGPFVLEVALVHLGGGARTAVTALASLAVLAVIGLCCRPSLGRGLSGEQLARRRFGEASAVLCGMVLLSPMSSKSHFCVLLFPIAHCVDRYLRARDRLTGAALVLLLLLGPCTMKGLVSRDVGNWFLAYGAVTWCAALALVATASTLRRGDRDVSSERP